MDEIIELGFKLVRLLSLDQFKSVFTLMKPILINALESEDEKLAINLECIHLINECDAHENDYVSIVENWVKNPPKIYQFDFSHIPREDIRNMKQSFLTNILTPEQLSIIRELTQCDNVMDL